MTLSQVNDRIFGSRRGDQDQTSETVFIKLQGCIYAQAKQGTRASTTRQTGTVRHRGMETGISEASKRVSIFSFATQGGKQVEFLFSTGKLRQGHDQFIPSS